MTVLWKRGERSSSVGDGEVGKVKMERRKKSDMEEPRACDGQKIKRLKQVKSRAEVSHDWPKMTSAPLVRQTGNSLKSDL
jgi:hypothetical protein